MLIPSWPNSASLRLHGPPKAKVHGYISVTKSVCMTIATEAASSSSAASVIILAAGVGRRLGLSQADACLPKVLLEFGGRSLLARHISILRKCGMSNITVVAGYRAQLLRAEIARIEGGSTVSIIENFDYQEGSVVSLWTAREILRSVSRVILMDGDVLYDERLMTRLVSTRLKNCLLLDRNIEPGDEPVKIWCCPWSHRGFS